MEQDRWGPGWEDGIPRVTTGQRNLTSRLRCLGNAVVPQQVFPILKAIAEIETGVAA
jgi:DNA (cytosine-5)-methyltransferase 1